MGLFCIFFGWAGELAASSGWPRFGRNGVRHAMKSKTKLQRVNYTFRRDQVLSVDIGEFLRIYDPTRLSPFHLRCLFGRLHLAIEDMMECEDAATIPDECQTFRRWWNKVASLTTTTPLVSLCQSYGLTPMAPESVILEKGEMARAAGSARNQRPQWTHSSSSGPSSNLCRIWRMVSARSRRVGSNRPC